MVLPVFSPQIDIEDLCEVFCFEDENILRSGLEVAIGGGCPFEKVLTSRQRLGAPPREILLFCEVDSGGRLCGTIVDQTRRSKTDEVLQWAQKMSIVGELSSGVVHDINNILQVVMSGLELMQNEKMSDQARDLLTEMEKVLGRGRRLSRSVLSLSSSTTEAVDAIDVVKAAQRAVAMAKRSMPKGVSLFFDSALSESGTVFVEAGDFEHALLNLIFNARNASAKKGSIEVSVRYLQALDELEGSLFGAQPFGPCAVVSVRDEGRGVPEGLMQKVVEPFFTTASEGSGAGLGLSRVRELCEKTGGALCIRNNANGAGATFEMIFPFVSCSLPPSPVSLSVGKPGTETTKTDRILVAGFESIDHGLEKPINEMGACLVEEPVLSLAWARHKDAMLFDLIVVGPRGVCSMSHAEFIDLVRSIDCDVPIIACHDLDALARFMGAKNVEIVPEFKKPGAIWEAVSARMSALRDTVEQIG